ncbi:MAG: magnesium/cobalt transporter CorA [Bacteroidia bacterium]
MTQYDSDKSGVPPGTLIYLGRETTAKVNVTVLEYNDKDYSEHTFENIDDALLNVRNGMIKWINVDGVHNTDIVERIGKMFNIHPLTLEDLVNTNQRPKFEDYDHYVIGIMKMIYQEECEKKGENIFVAEQLSIILLDRQTVITFQEADGGDVFDIIRTRIRQGKGRIRKCGADYLMYALIDSVVDSYFSVLEKIGDEIEELEEELTANPQNETMRKIHSMKRQMIYLRKAFWPMRELINNMERSESELINDSTLIYLRDAHDHTIRVIDTVETFRDLLSGMMDLYMSGVSNRMNEVMKTLTIITTVFVPLTFIVGVYGMNFDFMPELHSKYGYPAVILVMLIIVIFMFGFFRRKKWL